MIRRVFQAPTLAVLVGLSLVGASAQRAEAGLLPTLLSVTPDGGNFKFFYSVEVPGGNGNTTVVHPGDSFTVYDVQGLVSGSINYNAVNGNWNVSVGNVTPPPAGLTVADNPAIPNIHFVYAPSPAQNLSGPAGVTFSFDSTFSNVFTPDASQNQFNVASTTHLSGGGVENSLTTTGVPSPSATGGQTPEPATLALMGFGLPMLGAFQFYRRRRIA
jgi:hypothetical protein